MRARNGSLVLALVSCLGCQLISGVGDYGFVGAGASAGNAGGDGGGGATGGKGGTGGGAPNDFVVGWVQPAGAAGASKILAADASAQQSLVSVVGTLDGNIDFGEGAVSANDGALVGKLNREGQVGFANAYEASTGASPFIVAESTALVPTGGSYVAGLVQGAVDFGGPAAFDATATSVFVVKLDQDGNGIWAATFARAGVGNAESTVLGIGVGASTVTIAGTLDNATLATVGCMPATVGGAATRNGYFIVLDADDGSCLQARSYGPGVGIHDLTARDDRIYFVGDYQGSPDIVGAGMPPSPDHTNFIATANVTDPDSPPLFAPLTYPTEGDDAATHIAVFANGIAVMGAALGRLTTPDSQVLEPIGTVDVWVTSLESMGTPVWTKRFGAAGEVQVPGGIAIDEGGIMGGITCSGPVDLGRGAVVASDGGQACVGVWDVEGSGATLYSGAWGPEATIKGVGSLGGGTLTIAGFTNSTVDFDIASVTSTGAESRAFAIGFGLK